MTRAFRKSKAKPSAPRTIRAANDDAPAVANDNAERLQVGGVLLTPEQTRRFRAAEAGEASADHRLKVSGRAAMIQLEIEIREALARQRVTADLAETAALEEGRKEAVGVSNDWKTKGQIHVSGRDGLRSLHAEGLITDEQWAAGLVYRSRYDLIDPDRGLTPPDPSGSRTISNGGKDWAETVARARSEIAAFERELQSSDPTFRGAMGRTSVERLGLAVHGMREVAGKGRTVRFAFGAGRAHGIGQQAIRRALDLAIVTFRVVRPDGKITVAWFRPLDEAER